MKYIIKSIDEKNSKVVVVFDIDNKNQTIYAPIETKNAWHNAIVKYGQAYESGLAIQNKTVKASEEIKSVINIPQEAVITEKPENII